MNQNIKLYRVNKEDYRLESLLSTESIIEKILKESIASYNKEKSRAFSMNDVSSLKKGDLTYYLYVYNFAEKQSDWLAFFPSQLTRSQNFTVLNISLLLFVDNGVDIFIVVGGQAFRLIVPFIDHTFGLTVISKVINPEKDLISSINSRGLTGTRSGLSEQFRNDLRIIDFARFGKVPVSIHLTLSEEISNEYFKHLQNKKNERIRIYGGKSFKIKKNVNFEELNEILIELGYIMGLEENDYLSTYIEEKNTKFVNQYFRPLLINAIFNDLNYISRSVESSFGRFKFDFSHPDKLAQFYEADCYVLKEKVGEKSYLEFDRVESRADIYENVLKRAISLGKNINDFTFRAYIQGVRVLSYTDGKISSSASFLYHFTCEFSFNNKPIFLVDNKWYRLKNSFITDLEFECVQTLKANKLPKNILYHSWDKAIHPKESEYNLLYNRVENYLIFDTIIMDGIELCDILYIEDDQIYLIHVKYGFDASLRELANQITLSARRLHEDIKSGEFKYIRKIYSSYVKRDDREINLTETEFVSLFSRRITYVFAFASNDLSDTLVENNIKKYRSNIARYSLVQCSKDMQTFMYDLKISQIMKREMPLTSATR